MVVLISWSFSLAQNPKSARKDGEQRKEGPKWKSKWLTELDLSTQSQEYIVRLDIPMNDAQMMQVMYSLQCLAAYSSNLWFCHHVGRYHVRQRATFHIFHHYPKFASDQKGIDKVDNVFIPSLTHHQDLVDNQLFLWLLGKIHLLDGDWDIGINRLSGIYTTRGTRLISLSVLCSIPVI